MEENQSDKHLEDIIAKALIRKGEQQGLDSLAKIDSTNELRNIIDEAEKRHQPSLRKPAFWISISSAAVIALLLTIGLQPRYSTTDLYENWHDAVLYEPIVSRGGEEEFEEMHRMAFEKALKLTSSNQTQEAIQELLIIISDRNSDYLNEARWQLAIIYLKINQRESAIENLKAITDDDSEYSVQAKELLDNIEQKKWF